MRCRKVRSCLSAYCNDELVGRKAQGVSEHLSTCSGCRQEESFYKSLHTAGQSMSGLAVSSDFNNKLLNRIAQERFAETRSAAYMPKRSPRIIFSRVIPAVISACLVLVVGISYLGGSNNLPNQQQPLVAQSNSGLDDSYLTVQPTNNPNWSLNAQLARAERIRTLSTSMSGDQSFHRTGTAHLANATQSNKLATVPYVRNYLRIRPVIKIYIAPQPAGNKEAGSTK